MNSNPILIERILNAPVEKVWKAITDKDKMTNQIYQCLWFNGQAKEAAEFYCSVFKNSKITTDTPMVVIFELNGKKFMD